MRFPRDPLNNTAAFLGCVSNFILHLACWRIPVFRQFALLTNGLPWTAEITTSCPASSCILLNIAIFCSLRFFQKLFKAKPVQETPFDRAVKDAVWLAELRCGSADSFEVLLAYVFGAFLVKCCGGVFDDPQTGQFYDDYTHLETEIMAIIAQLQEQKKAGELLTHPFREWA